MLIGDDTPYKVPLAIGTPLPPLRQVALANLVRSRVEHLERLFTTSEGSR